MSLSTSPFPPIADYAFLSNCHTGALVAPDGSVDWLCVPSFDSPSASGNLLDRGAGSFRLGPYGINVPTQRSYVPGTNVLTTTWHTPGGWLLVHDALTMGPRHGPDAALPGLLRQCRGLRLRLPDRATLLRPAGHSSVRQSFAGDSSRLNRPSLHRRAALFPPLPASRILGDMPPSSG